MKFATGNIHKWEEANVILGGSLEMIDLDLPELQSLDVVEVVEHKARAAYDLVGAPVFVEDVSLVFEARDALPGPFIKWFLVSVGTQGLLDQLASFENRNAEALCCVGCFDGEKVHSFIGSIKGKITRSIKGASPFGWDPIFQPLGEERTFAEMGVEEKNLISHRKKAWTLVKEYLEFHPDF